MVGINYYGQVVFQDEALTALRYCTSCPVRKQRVVEMQSDKILGKKSGCRRKATKGK